MLLGGPGAWGVLCPTAPLPLPAPAGAAWTVLLWHGHVLGGATLTPTTLMKPSGGQQALVDAPT